MIPLMGMIFSLFLLAESRMHKTPGSNTLSRTHDGILKMYGAFFNQGKCFTVILISHSLISGFGQVSCFLRKQIPSLRELKSVIYQLFAYFARWPNGYNCQYYNLYSTKFNIPRSPSNQFTPSQSKLKSKKGFGSSNELSASCSFSYRI